MPNTPTREIASASIAAQTHLKRRLMRERRKDAARRPQEAPKAARWDARTTPFTEAPPPGRLEHEKRGREAPPLDSRFHMLHLASPLPAKTSLVFRTEIDPSFIFADNDVSYPLRFPKTTMSAELLFLHNDTGLAPVLFGQAVVVFPDDVERLVKRAGA